MAEFYLRAFIEQFMKNRASNPAEQKKVLQAVGKLSDDELAGILTPQLNEMYVELLIMAGLNPYAKTQRSGEGLHGSGHPLFPV
jgi:hypothetical protein